MIALIMAGGVGSRFWPLSRKTKPKQFLNIISEKSMIKMTVERLNHKIKLEDIYIVTQENQVELLKKELPILPTENILVEPMGRNTAPCIAFSAFILKEKYGNDEKMLVVPADHYIPDSDEFWEKTNIGDNLADQGGLITFGITPTFPATGYGYIEVEKSSNEYQKILQFKEKPDEDLAKSFLENGNFYWNSGMFVWKIGVILEQFEKYLPKIYSLLQQINERVKANQDFAEIYRQMPNIPVDIGILEQAEERFLIPVSYFWSDVGSWKALYEISKKDEKGNVINSAHFFDKVENSYFSSDKFVAAINVKNVAIIDSKDAILVMNLDDSQKVKSVVEFLKNNNEKLL